MHRPKERVLVREYLDDVLQSEYYVMRVIHRPPSVHKQAYVRVMGLDVPLLMATAPPVAEIRMKTVKAESFADILSKITGGTA